MSDQFFGSEPVASSEMPNFPRYAVGVPDGKLTVDTIQGVYEGTRAITIKKQQRLLHQVKVSDPMPDQKGEPSERIFVWGNYEIDDTLPTLATGTKIRVKYTGTEKIAGGHTIKHTPVQFPAAAKRVPNRFKKVVDEEAPF